MTRRKMSARLNQDAANPAAQGKHELAALQERETHKREDVERRRQSWFGFFSYVLETIIQQFVFGNASERYRFLHRLRHASARTLFQIRAKIQIGLFALRTMALPHDEKQMQRRNYGWKILTCNLSNQSHLLSWRENKDRLRILVIASGDIGDALQITPFIHALKTLAPSAEISLLHTCANVEKILGGNPDLTSLSHAAWWRSKSLIETGLASDVVDVVAHVRYAVEYIVSPSLSTEKKTKFPPRFFAEAEQNFVTWEKLLHQFPRQNNVLGRKAQQDGLHIFDVMGRSGNLPITRDSRIFFSTSTHDTRVLQKLSAYPRYITIHDGAQKVMMEQSPSGRITKMLPPETWKETVRLLREQELEIVQLGLGNEPAIEGVSVDLRGQCTLQETAIIIKNAVCHLDTEGGLVHLARAMQTRSVVLFGPTPVEFFGYSENINLAPTTCSNCWWITEDWCAHCPRSFTNPVCMTEHAANGIVSAVLSIVRSR